MDEKARCSGGPTFLASCNVAALDVQGRWCMGQAWRSMKTPPTLLFAPLFFLIYN